MRTLVTITMLACLLAEAGQAQAEPVRVRLALQWRHQAQFAGYYMAKERGYYRDQGIEVDILADGGPGRRPLERFHRGEAEFANTFLSHALALRALGAPVVHLAQVVNRSNLVLIARRDRHIDKLRDLDGKTISYWQDTLGGISFETLFRRQGLRPRVTPQYYSITLFLRGLVSACAGMAYSEPHLLAQSGWDERQLSIFPLRDHGLDFPEDGLYALASTCEQRPGLCQDFAAASLRGWQEAAAHPEEAVALVLAYAKHDHTPTNRTHMLWMLDHLLSAIFPGAGDGWRFGQLDRARYDETVEALLRDGHITATLPYEEFVWRP